MQSIEEKKARARDYYQANKEKFQAYNRSQTGKDAIKRYDQSEKGRARRSRVDAKRSATLKVRCRESLKKAIKEGKMVRGTCFCGAVGEAHHEDYNKPYEVVWLCRVHHREKHKDE